MSLRRKLKLSFDFLGSELESQQEQNDHDLSLVIQINDLKKGRVIAGRLC